jgi:hypothetical protein
MLELTDAERAVLLAALRRLVERDPDQLALKAILEKLELQKPEPIPETASTG